MANENYIKFGIILQEGLTEDLPLEWKQFVKMYNKFVEVGFTENVLLGLLFYGMDWLWRRNLLNSPMSTQMMYIFKDILHPTTSNALNFFNDRNEFLPHFYAVFFDKKETKDYTIDIVWEEIYFKYCNQYGTPQEKITNRLNQYTGKKSQVKSYKQRTSFIKVCDMLIAAGTPDALLIGLLYLENEISRPALSRFSWSSEMHDITTELLQELKNPSYPDKLLNEFDPIIFQSMLYCFLTKQIKELAPLQQALEEYLDSPRKPEDALYWESYTSLTTEVRDMLRIFIDKEKPKMNEILGESYPVDYILSEINKYINSCEGKKFDKKEDEALKLLKIVSQRAEEKMKLLNENCRIQQNTNEEKAPVNIDIELYGLKKMLLGALVYILSDLSSESDTHKACLAISNFKSLDKQLPELICKWLGSFSCELDNVNQAHLINSEGMKRIISKVEEVKKTYDEKKQSATKYTLTKCTQLGVRQGLGFLASTGVVTGILGFLGTSLSNFTGPVGSMVWIGGVWLVKYIGDQALPKAVTDGWDMVANTISEKVAPGVIAKLDVNREYFFSADKENLDKVLEELEKVQNQEQKWHEIHNTRDWIQAHLALPNDDLTFPEFKKRELEKLFFNKKTNEIDEGKVRRIAAFTAN